MQNPGLTDKTSPQDMWRFSQVVFSIASSMSLIALFSKMSARCVRVAIRYLRYATLDPLVLYYEGGKTSTCMFVNPPAPEAIRPVIMPMGLT